MKEESRARIDQLFRRGDCEDWVAFLPTIQSTSELSYLLDGYNWDDGFEVPIAISNHPYCDLGVALSLWWLADGGAWFERPNEVSEYMQDWGNFCREMTSRISSGIYDSKHESNCLVKRSDSYKAKLEGLGLPAVFFQGSEQE